MATSDSERVEHRAAGRSCEKQKNTARNEPPTVKALFVLCFSSSNARILGHWSESSQKLTGLIKIILRHNRVVLNSTQCAFEVVQNILD